MAIAQNVNTIYYYSSEWLFRWNISDADSESPNDVYSISYGGLESDLESFYTSSFNTEALKLG